MKTLQDEIAESLLATAIELYNEGLSLKNEKRLLESISIFDILILNDEEAGVLWFGRGMARLELAELQEQDSLFLVAINDFFQATLKSPDLDNPWIWLRDTCFLQGKKLGNIQYLALGVDAALTVVELHPQDPSHWSRKGEVEYQLAVNTKDLALLFQSAESFKKASILAPDDIRFYTRVQLSLYEAACINGDTKVTQESIAFGFKALESPYDSNNSDFIYHRGLSSYHVAICDSIHNVRNFKTAIFCLSEAIKAVGSSDDLELWLGNCYMQFGMTTEDPSALKKAIEILSNLPNLSIQDRTEIVRMKITLGRWTWSPSILKEAVLEGHDVIVPTLPESYLPLAQAQNAFGQMTDDAVSVQEAVTNLNITLAHNPTEIVGLNQRAGALLTLGRMTGEISVLNAALRDLDTLISIDHNDANAFMNKGFALSLLMLHESKLSNQQPPSANEVASYYLRSAYIVKGYPIYVELFLDFLKRYGLNYNFFLSKYIWHHTYLLTSLSHHSLFTNASEDYEGFLIFKSEFEKINTDQSPASVKTRCITYALEYLGGDPIEAFHGFEKLDRIFEEDLRTQHYLILTAFEILHPERQNILKNAIDLSEAEVKIIDTSSMQLYYAARIFTAAGRYDDAIVCFERALNLGFSASIFGVAEVFEMKYKSNTEKTKSEIEKITLHYRNLKIAEYEIEEWLTWQFMSLQDFFAHFTAMPDVWLTEKFILSKEIARGLLLMKTDGKLLEHTNTIENFIRKEKLVSRVQQESLLMSAMQAESLERKCNDLFPYLMEKLSTESPSNDVHFSDIAYSILIMHYEDRIHLLPNVLNLLFYQKIITVEQWVSLNLFFQLKCHINRSIEVKSRLSQKFASEMVQSLCDVITILSLPIKIFKIMEIIAEDETLRISIIKSDYRYFKLILTDLYGKIPEDFLSEQSHVDRHIL